MRVKHHVIPCIGGIKKKKKDTNELMCRTETDLHTLKTLWLPKGTGVRDGTDGLGWE